MKAALRRAYPVLKSVERRIKLAPPGYRAKRKRELIRAMTQILAGEVKGAKQ